MTSSSGSGSSTCPLSPPPSCAPSLVAEPSLATTALANDHDDASLVSHDEDNEHHSDVIPRIDARQLQARNPNTLQLVRKAVVHPGFLIVTNTAIDRSEVLHVIETYRDFFHQPTPVKAQVDMARTHSNRGWGAPHSEQVNPQVGTDYKEYFDVGYELRQVPSSDADAYSSDNDDDKLFFAPNQWPNTPSHFRRTISNYYGKACDVAMEVLRGIAASIGRDETYFDSAFTHPMALLRGNYYPARQMETTTTTTSFGIAPHTDYGCLTLLATDGVPGLQVQTANDGSSSNNETWIPVHVQPGDFVVNFGEMLQLWANGKIRATPHRVVAPPAGQERISVPLFFNPNPETNVAPPPTSKDDCNQSVIRAGTHLSRRFSETYLHLHQQQQQ